MNNPDAIQHQVCRPGGPHILAQWLSSHGITVKVIDFCSVISTNDLVDITRKHIKADTVAIGVSTTFWDHDSFLKYGEVTTSKKLATLFTLGQVSSPDWVINARTLIESAFPNLDWILGGANSEIHLREHWIKFHNHPEDQVLRYLDAKLTIKKTRIPFDIHTSTNTYMDGLGLRANEALTLEWGRGCQFKCSFCRYKLNGKKKGTYLRDVELVRHDLIQNYERYGITRYAYVDDTINESVEKVEAMARVAQSLPFELEWVGYGRLDLIGTNKHTIKTLVDSGLRGMFFGVESFNKEASKIIGKGWNGVHGKDFLLELKDTWKDQVNITPGFIIGLEPETPDEVDQTSKWLISNEFSSWSVTPLHISATANLLTNASEFDKSCTKYGYRFPAAGSPNYWISNNWTSATAQVKAHEIVKASFNLAANRPAVFGAAGISSITGESIKITMSKKPDFAVIRSGAMRIFDEYVTYQLNLPD